MAWIGLHSFVVGHTLNIHSAPSSKTAAASPVNTPGELYKTVAAYQARGSDLIGARRDIF